MESRANTLLRAQEVEILRAAAQAEKAARLDSKAHPAPEIPTGKLMDAATRKYLADIGRQGGKAGKGTPLRREIAKRAAAARWGKKKKRLHTANAGTDR